MPRCSGSVTREYAHLRGKSGQVRRWSAAVGHRRFSRWRARMPAGVRLVLLPPSWPTGRSQRSLPGTAVAAEGFPAPSRGPERKSRAGCDAPPLRRPVGRSHPERDGRRLRRQRRGATHARPLGRGGRLAGTTTHRRRPLRGHLRRGPLSRPGADHRRGVRIRGGEEQRRRSPPGRAPGWPGRTSCPGTSATASPSPTPGPPRNSPSPPRYAGSIRPASAESTWSPGCARCWPRRDSSWTARRTGTSVTDSVSRWPSSPCAGRPPGHPPRQSRSWPVPAARTAVSRCTSASARASATWTPPPSPSRRCSPCTASARPRPACSGCSACSGRTAGSPTTPAHRTPTAPAWRHRPCLPAVACSPPRGPTSSCAACRWAARVRSPTGARSPSAAPILPRARPPAPPPRGCSA